MEVSLEMMCMICEGYFAGNVLIVLTLYVVFCLITPYSLVDGYQCFRETYCHHLHGNCISVKHL